ncbi:MAG TPA: hypothetical protein VLK35_08300 [Methylomirabilota bacterium]|nr:hypothetical protein [Methylomirabilota bacterium]
MTRGAAGALIATLAAVLAAGAAHAQSAWVLWERPVPADSRQPPGAWQRREVFDAERWCKGAMTRAINQTLASTVKDGRWDPHAKISEFQCQPDGADPRGAPSK